MKQLRLWLLGLFALCGIAAVAQEAKADSTGYIEKDIWQKHKSDPDFMLMGIDRDEPLNKVIAFGKSTGVTYPLGLDPGADIFAKYALRQAGITRNVLIDKEGRIVMLTRLYNPEEFSSLVRKIDELLK